MAKQQRKLQDVTLHSRTGEGTLLNAMATPVIGTDGQTLVAMSFNLREAPVPDRRYAADFASVIVKGEIVKLVFGQEKIPNDEIRSLVVISMSTTDVRLLVRSMTDMHGPSLNEIAQTVAFGAVSLREIQSEPDQTIAMTANYVAIAASGRMACIDFYSASAFAIADVGKLNGLAVDAVVRIDLPASYLLALQESLIALEPTFPADVILVGEQNAGI